MFGRATITLGIGPHSSVSYLNFIDISTLLYKLDNLVNRGH